MTSDDYTKKLMKEHADLHFERLKLTAAQVVHRKRVDELEENLKKNVRAMARVRKKMDEIHVSKPVVFALPRMTAEALRSVLGNAFQRKANHAGLLSSKEFLALQEFYHNLIEELSND